MPIQRMTGPVLLQHATGKTHRAMLAVTRPRHLAWAKRHGVKLVTNLMTGGRHNRETPSAFTLKLEAIILTLASMNPGEILVFLDADAAITRDTPLHTMAEGVDIEASPLRKAGEFNTGMLRIRNSVKVHSFFFAVLVEMLSGGGNDQDAFNRKLNNWHGHVPKPVVGALPAEIHAYRYHECWGAAVRGFHGEERGAALLRMAKLLHPTGGAA